MTALLALEDADAFWGPLAIHFHRSIGAREWLTGYSPSFFRPCQQASGDVRGFPAVYRGGFSFPCRATFTGLRLWPALQGWSEVYAT